MRYSSATKCISEVPRLVKQVSTPEASRLRIRASAPFIADLLFEGAADNGGVRGIRTLDTGLSRYNALAGRPLRPLGHHSGGTAILLWNGRGSPRPSRRP